MNYYLLLAFDSVLHSCGILCVCKASLVTAKDQNQS